MRFSVRLAARTAFLVLLGWTTAFAADAESKLPLTSTRTARFTVDEGTWMSVDVSPDGKTIIFDLLGHLYEMPIAGGTAHAITSGLEFDSEPRFSPDGKHIAFVSDRSGAENLWIANPDGSSPQQLSNLENALFSSPSWTPDSRSVLVSRRRPYTYDASLEVWQYDISGGEGVAITKGKSSPTAPSESWHNALGPVQAPHEQAIYYARHYGYFPEDDTLPSWDVVRRDLKTGDEEPLTNAPGGSFRPQLSPDGTLIVYATRFDGQTGLRIHNLKDGTERWLKFPVEHDDLESYAPSRDVLPGYSFLPDGKQILISFGGKIHLVNVADGKDQLVPFSAEVVRELGPHLLFPTRADQGPVKARTFQGATQSPDGKHLAFSTFTHIYVQDFPSGTPRRLTQGTVPEFEPVWSPDGRWIAFVTWQNQEGYIWKIASDGSGAPQKLTTIKGYYRDPAWSPDGTRIVALRDSFLPRQEIPNGMGIAENMDLVWVPASGGEPNLIAHGHGEWHPHFGTDPNRIFFSQAEQWPSLKPIELVSMRWDGSDRKVILRITNKFDWGREFSPYMSVETSPDEKHGLTLFRNQLYLFAMPQKDGEAPLLDLSKPGVSVRRLSPYGADHYAWGKDGASIKWYLGASFFELPFSASLLTDASANPHGSEDALHQKWPSLSPRTATVDLSLPRATPTGTYVLRGARVITMRGDEVLPSADLVIENNRIKAVGASGSVAIPTNAKVFDVTGKTIIPGFIDVHAHYVEVHREILDLQNWDFFANLAYGVTTGRDVQAFTPDVLAYQDLVDAGLMIGPRAYNTGFGIYYVNDFQSVDEVKGVLTRYRDFYKTNTVKSYLIGNRRQREYMVQGLADMHMMATTEGAADLKLDLTHVIDGFTGSEHTLPNLLYKDTVELFAKAGTFYTPTMLIGYGGPGAIGYYAIATHAHDDPKLRHFVPHNIIDARTRRLMWIEKSDYFFPLQAKSAADVIRAGGNVCVGSEGMLQGPGFHWALWALQSGGMTPLEALHSATICGATTLGLDRDLGSLEPGKLADMMVLDKNPLDDIRNTAAIQWVIKDGVVFNGNTLEEIWPQAKPGPTVWWSNEDPVH